MRNYRKMIAYWSEVYYENFAFRLFALLQLLIWGIHHSVKKQPSVNNFLFHFCLYKNFTITLSYSALNDWNTVRTCNHLVYNQTLNCSIYI